MFCFLLLISLHHRVFPHNTLVQIMDSADQLPVQRLDGNPCQLTGFRCFKKKMIGCENSVLVWTPDAIWGFCGVASSFSQARQSRRQGSGCLRTISDAVFFPIFICVVPFDTPETMDASQENKPSSVTQRNHFQCSYCQRAFGRVDHLTRHIRSR